jgi:hypothetical protein
MSKKNIRQKIHVLYSGDGGGSDKKLDELLVDGWKITQTCPMPSGGQTKYKPHCLVVLEKEK